MKSTGARAMALIILLAAAGSAVVAVTAQHPQSASSQVLLPAGARTTDGSTTYGPAGSQLSPPASGSAGDGIYRTGDSGGSAARIELQRALARHPRDPAQLRELAAELLTDNPSAGITAYSELVAAYPNDAGAWRGLSAARIQTGDRKGAMAALDRSLKLAPNSAEARLLLGKLLVSEAPFRTAAALREWKKAIELAPDTRAAREATSLVSLYEGR